MQMIKSLIPLLFLVGCTGSCTVGTPDAEYEPVERCGKLVYMHLDYNIVDPSVFEIGIEDEAGYRHLYKAKQNRRNWNEAMRIKTLYQLDDQVCITWLEKKKEDDSSKTGR